MYNMYNRIYIFLLYVIFLCIIGISMYNRNFVMRIVPRLVVDC